MSEDNTILMVLVDCPKCGAVKGCLLQAETEFSCEECRFSGTLRMSLVDGPQDLEMEPKA